MILPLCSVLIRSHLKHCLSLWGPQNKKDMDLLKQAMRILKCGTTSPAKTGRESRGCSAWSLSSSFRYCYFYPEPEKKKDQTVVSTVLETLAKIYLWAKSLCKKNFPNNCLMTVEDTQTQHVQSQSSNRQSSYFGRTDFHTLDKS